MPYQRQRRRRKSLRLKGYDYAGPGAYFVTICVRNRECALGRVINGEMVLTDAGRIVDSCWADLPNHYPHVRLDAYITMPNHVHGIIVLVDDDDDNAAVGGGLKPPPTAGLKHTATASDPTPATTSDPTPATTSDPTPATASDPTPATGPVPVGLKPTPTTGTARKHHGLSEIVRAFKTFSARRINELRGTPGLPFWQRGFYDRIIRSDRDLEAVRRYIEHNPTGWTSNRDNP